MGDGMNKYRVDEGLQGKINSMKEINCNTKREENYRGI